MAEQRMVGTSSLILGARALSVSALLVLVVGSCSDPLGPADVAGTYALQSPVQVAKYVTHADTLVTDTLVLLTDFSLNRRSRVERTTDAGVEVLEATADLEYVISDGTVELPLVTDVFAMFPPRGRYEFVNGQLVASSGYPATYVRVPGGAP